MTSLRLRTLEGMQIRNLAVNTQESYVQQVSLILFRATAETLSTIAADPEHLGAEIGFFAVLHTWGQNLLFHPHLHCVVGVPDGI
jgi:Putative transposase